jgi:hypothetical protein
MKGGIMINFRPLRHLRHPETGEYCVFRAATAGFDISRIPIELQEPYRLGFFVDLRTDDERRTVGKTGDFGGLSVTHVPIENRRSLPAHRPPEPNDYADWYEEILHDSGFALAHALATIANLVDGGVLFGCTQGKDRSGLLAAAILEAAGVSRVAILDDYGLSGPALDYHAQLFAGHWLKKGMTRDSYVKRYWLGSEPLARLYDRLNPTSTPILSILAYHAPAAVRTAADKLTKFVVK